METILTVLGMILSTLMEIPARSVAKSDAQKTILAKALSEFVSWLDRILARGYAILAQIERLASLDNKDEFVAEATGLLELVSNQISDLVLLRDFALLRDFKVSESLNVVCSGAVFVCDESDKPHSFVVDGTQ